MLTSARIQSVHCFSHPLGLPGWLGALGAAPEPRVLVYTKNQVGKGLYVHANIPASVAAIKKLGEENEFAVDVSDDPAVFTDAESQALQGPDLRQHEQRDLRQRGTEGRVAALHPRAAAGLWASIPRRGSMRQWPWFWSVLGGKFSRHAKLQTFTIHVKDAKDLSTAHLPRHVRVDGRVLLRGSHARRACTCCWPAT